MPIAIERTDGPGLQSCAARESALLAPYAMHSCDSAGRRYEEPLHSYRGPYQRDRDRVVHSSAFRRLSGKMQVFTGEMGDYHRTRLTHTHEVASIARTIGRALRLNEDLIESLALLHDIGHPPYGHAGEAALRECLRDQGGFSHNQFGLTIAEELETCYPDFPGLNLTAEVLEGQTTRVDKDQGGRLLEVQVVDAADSITYDAHDTDDAVKLGLVSLADLEETTLVRESLARVHRRYAALDETLLRRALVHELIERQVSDLLMRAGPDLMDSGLQSAEEARRSDVRLGAGGELAEQKLELERFLFQRVYRHPQVTSVCRQAQQRVREMYENYLLRPDLLPDRYQRRAERIGIRRMAGEYIGGMTDHFFNALHRQYLQSGNDTTPGRDTPFPD
ncbi:dGTP triphosphohydrolase [Lignipirellula cremea]|uniref:Deoxyguanosinetriphosphate triphosphohydrolase-like protein n=1 Tax=Lignipirellula cremea TaxID=2528010 RepID=A0A518DY57_9BACT|nr:dNTP triphosphohydrolase [Lignipirellula cremea]QDU96725.1 Deoxyguanosinetriphosphate triphosphohydrolase [Lignipirellula cremea]